MLGITMNRRTLVNILYFLFCSTGFGYQFYEIASEYLNYYVRTDLQLQIPDKISSMGFSVCIDYKEIFNYELYEQKTGHKVSSSNIEQYATIKDIFEYTPSEKETIKNCFIRRLDLFSTEQY